MKASFSNPENDSFVVTQMDGCVQRNQLAADYIVSKAGVGDIIVELKGSNVDHAAKQVLATAKFIKTSGSGLGLRPSAALIVCRQYPRIDTTIQKAKQKFSREFRAPLHVKSKNLVYKFERVLAFDGPL